MNRIEAQPKKSVIEYCARIGADPLLVQGAGGNVSWKEADTLWVKASGTWLAEATEKDIFLPVELSHLRAAMDSGDFSVAPKLRGESTLRPSIETLLHALMPHRVVIHLHPVEILAHLVRESCEYDFQSLLDKSIEWILVDYHKPGANLATAIALALVQKPSIDVVFLRNHGVVVGAFSVEEADNLLSKLISMVSTPIDSSIIGTKNLQPIAVASDQQYIPVDIPDIHSLASCPDLFNRLKTDWALYPDHVVFLGPSSRCYDTVELLIHDLRSGNSPEFIFLKDQGVFSKPNMSMAKKAQLRCYFDVIIRQPKNQRLRVMDKAQVGELLNWDAEKYRNIISK